MWGSGLDSHHSVQGPMAGSCQQNEKHLGSTKAGQLLVMSIKLADEHPGICSLKDTFFRTIKLKVDGMCLGMKPCYPSGIHLLYWLGDFVPLCYYSYVCTAVLPQPLEHLDVSGRILPTPLEKLCQQIWWSCPCFDPHNVHIRPHPEQTGPYRPIKVMNCLTLSLPFK